MALAVFADGEPLDLIRSDGCSRPVESDPRPGLDTGVGTRRRHRPGRAGRGHRSTRSLAPRARACVARRCRSGWTASTPHPPQPSSPARNRPNGPSRSNNNSGDRGRRHPLERANPAARSSSAAAVADTAHPTIGTPQRHEPRRRPRWHRSCPPRAAPRSARPAPPRTPHAPSPAARPTTPAAPRAPPRPLARARGSRGRSWQRPRRGARSRCRPASASCRSSASTPAAVQSTVQRPPLHQRLHRRVVHPDRPRPPRRMPGNDPPALLDFRSSRPCGRRRRSRARSSRCPTSARSATNATWSLPLSPPLRSRNGTISRLVSRWSMRINGGKARSFGQLADSPCPRASCAVRDAVPSRSRNGRCEVVALKSPASITGVVRPRTSRASCRMPGCPTTMLASG